MDHMDPIQTESIAGKIYIFVIVDDISRYTWVRFLIEKTVKSFKILALKLKLRKGALFKYEVITVVNSKMMHLFSSIRIKGFVINIQSHRHYNRVE